MVIVQQELRNRRSKDASQELCHDIDDTSESSCAEAGVPSEHGYESNAWVEVSSGNRDAKQINNPHAKQKPSLRIANSQVEDSYHKCSH
jgi:hypothetical protein